MPKTRTLRKIDLPPPVSQGRGGSPTGSGATNDVVPPATTPVGAPQSLALTTGVAYSSAAPSAYINAAWEAPETSTGVEPEAYTIQVSTGSTFLASGTITATANGPSAQVGGLVPGTLYYVRVRAYASRLSGPWTSMSPLTTGVNRITAATDTTAAGVATGITATWIGTGDLLITWTNPTEANLKDVRVVVKTASGGTTLRTTYTSAGRFLYTYAMNGTDTAGSSDSSLWVELTSRTFSNVLGTTVNTGLVTKTAPATPASVTHSWTGDTGAARDDWVISWAPASDAAQYRLVIDGVTRYIAGAASSFTYTLGANDVEHPGTPDPVLVYTLAALDSFGLVSTTVSGTATNAAPSTPGTLTTSWASDTGAAGPDCTISWVASTGATQGYILTIDGVARALSGTRYIYTLDANRAEHAGTPDPVLTIAVVARDGYQSSSSAGTTATNAAPATTAITITAGFSALAASATPSTAGDFRDYTFRIILGGVTQATYRSTSPDQLYKATVGGSYTVGVKVNDLFGQASTETVSSAVVLDALTIEELRSELSYTSDDGQTQADLNKLKDGDLSVAATSHALSATAWRTITASRALIDRYGQITFVPGAISGGTLKVYFGLSLDGVSFTWHSGPLGATGTTGQNTTLLAYGLEANAQTNAITVTAGTVYRFDVAALTEARYIVLKHRNTTAAYTLREFYPRRLLQTDDFQAEAIMAINIGAGQVTADKISVLNLQAVSAQMGALHMDGVIDIEATGGIYQGTGSFASPTTGLKVYNSSGVGKISGYNAGVEQVAIDTDGRLKAGAGVVTLDAGGATLLGGAPLTFKLSVFAGAFRGSIGINSIDELQVVADQGFRLRNAPSSGNMFIVDTSGNATVYGSATVLAGLNLGSGSGAASGTIAATANDSATTATTALLALGHNSSGTPGVGFGIDIPFTMESSTTADQNAALIRTTWVTATHASRAARMRFFVYDTAARSVMDLEASGSAAMIGFLGAGAVVRQSIGAAAPAGGTGVAAGGWSSAANRDAAITLLNNIRSALIANGLCST